MNDVLLTEIDGADAAAWAQILRDVADELRLKPSADEQAAGADEGMRD